MAPLLPALRAAERAVGLTGLGASLGMLVAVLLAHAAMLYGLDKHTFAYVALDRPAARPSLLVFGFTVGGASIAAVALALMAVGWLSLVPAQDGPWLGAAVQVSLILLIPALNEELLSRGYVFSALAEWLGKPFAIAFTSLGFGLLHFANPGANALSISLVTLAGIFLAAVLVATRSLYAAWMAHFAWNWVMAVLLHVPVSGLDLARPDYQIVDSGPDLVTGGSWGPEGGLGAAFGMTGALAYLYWRHSRTRHDDDKR